MRRAFSTVAKQVVPKFEEPSVLFNFVVRDHNQGAFRNGQIPTDAEAMEVATQFDSLNQKGLAYFSRFESGGQEFGSYTMSFRNPVDLLKQYVAAMPNGTEIRSLTRGGYGNSVAPLNPKDLEKWMGLVNESTNGRTAFKIFDYNTFLPELQHCTQTAKQLGAKVEIAIPHSPEESYQPFFQKKVEEAAKFAAENGAGLSVKRMVAGLTVEEVRKVAHVVFAAAQKYGIKSVGLHAHGDVPAAVAEFAKIGHDYGIQTNVDFVHRGSGPRSDAPGTFSNIYDIGEQLAKRGIVVDLSAAQLGTLSDIDKLQQGRDKKYSAIRTGGAWTDSAKIAMGMPDGGESYSVEAIEKSSYSKKAGMDKQLANDIFEVYYKEFRERFGMPTSVTPGHKRIETGSIYSIEKTIDSVTQECTVDGKVDLSKVAKAIKGLTHQQLYSGMSPEIIDAFRNNELPQPLSQDAFKFICSEHMKNTLKQGAFKDLPQESKDALISMADNSKAVEEFAKKLVKEKLLPEAVLVGKDEKFCKESLIQASGAREYLESQKAPERYTTCYQAISARVEQGAAVANIANAAIIAAALTGGDTVYVDGSYRGSLPSAAGLTKEEHKKACADFYSKNHVDLSQKKAALPSNVNLLGFGTDGLFAGSVVDAKDAMDRPGAKIEPLESSAIVVAKEKTL